MAVAENSEVERDLSMEKQVPNEEEQAEGIEKEDEQEQAPEEVQEPAEPVDIFAK